MVGWLSTSEPKVTTRSAAPIQVFYNPSETSAPALPSAEPSVFRKGINETSKKLVMTLMAKYIVSNAEWACSTGGLEV